MRHSRILLFTLIIVSVMGIMGCSIFDSKYANIKKDILPLSKANGRIVFYRPRGFYGWGMRPDIHLNRNKIGRSLPGTIFYVDVNPGKYLISIPTILYPGEQTINIEISENETAYIKSYMSGSAIGGRTNIEVVNAELAIAEIENLEFITEPTK